MGSDPRSKRRREEREGGAEAEAEERDGDEGDGGGLPPLIEEAAEGGWIPVCARRGARSRSEAHVAGRLGSRSGLFPTRDLLTHSTRPGPDRPNEAHPGAASASANKRAGRFQVVSRSSLHHAVTSEQGTELSSSETDRKRDTR